MTNTKLLEYTGESRKLLTEIEKQTLYCLRLAMAKNPCPVCGKMLSLVEASGLTLDDYDASFIDKSHKCPDCKVPLIEIVPFFPHGNGGWFWEADRAWLKERLGLTNQTE